MKLFGSKSYTDAPPAPKMPPGLIELMEGLTKEVLKNNPTEVYEFCAEHMRKLIELRDHDTPKRCLTLEEKVAKANSVIRQRAEKRRQRYDDDMRILQQTEHLLDTPMKPKNNHLNDNSNNITNAQSGDNDNNGTTDNFDNEAITSEGLQKEHNRLDENIDTQTNPLQYEIVDNTIENAIVADDQTEDKSSKDPDADDINDKNKETTRGMFSQGENIDNPSKDNNDDVNDKEPVEEGKIDECEEKENYKLTHTFDSDHIATEEAKDSNILDSSSQINVIQESANNEENGHEDINEKDSIVDENNQLEMEHILTIPNNEQSEIKAGISEDAHVELGQRSKIDEGNQSPFKEEAAIIVKDNQKEIEEQSINNDEGDQNEVKQEVPTDDINNLEEVVQQPDTNENDNQNEIKDEVVTNKENNKKGTEDDNVTNDEDVIKDIIEHVTIHHNDELKEPVKQENDQDDVEKQNDTYNDKHPIEMEAQSSSNNQIDQTEIEERGDLKPITASKADIESEQDHREESITIVDTAKNDGSTTNQDKTAFESTEDKINDRPKDELNIVKGDGSICSPEDGNVDSNNLTSSNIEPEWASERDVSDTGTVSNIENLHINADSLHLDHSQAQDPHENVIIGKPLVINIDLQQNNQDLVSNSNPSQSENIANGSENNPVESKELGIVESKNSKPMDLETAAITIQKVFRNFLFRSKTSSFDDSTNIEFNIFDHDSDSKDIVYSNQNQVLNKDKRPMGISRMDTVLQTVNEEKSLSLSTDDSSTLSSAATVIQAHIRGFLVRSRLNRNKTLSSKSLGDSDEPPASFEADPDPAKSKTVLNIHIVPEGSHFLSRDESMLTSVELSLDGSPPASSNLHPLGYDKSERRKQLKREDAVQSISPPSNNSTRLSDEHDSVKEVLFNDVKKEAIDDELPADSITTEDSDSDDVLSKGTVEEKQIESPEPVRTSDERSEISKVASSDELDVITPFENVEGKNGVNLDGNKLEHSGEFHDVVLPTKVSRNDTSVVRGE